MKVSVIFTILIVTISLSLFVYADIQSPTVKEGEYKASVPLQNDFTMYWTIHQKDANTIEVDDIIEFALVGKTSGWIAIGVDFVNSAMNQADCYIGYYDVENKTAVVVDAYLPGKSIPKDDRVLNGTDNILEVNGSFDITTGLTTLKFTRFIDTEDRLTDKVIRNATINLSFSWNTNTKDITKKHTDAGTTTVNLFDLVHHENPTVPDTLIPFHWIATGCVVAFLAVAGIVYSFVSWKSPSTFALDFVFHRKLSKLIRNKYLGDWFINSILDITIGEIFLVIIYLMLAGTWFAYGYLNNMDGYELGKAFGYVDILNMTFLILPITRYSVLMVVFGVSFERGVKFHKWIARFTLLNTTVHGVTMVILNADGLDYLIQMDVPDFQLLGIIAYFCMVIIVAFTFEPIRRRFWELFKTVHLLFGIPVLILVNLHASGYKTMLPVMGFSLVLYAIDHLLRFVLGVLIPAKIVNLEYHEDSGVTVCTLQKSAITFYSFDRLGYGKFVYLYIPSVSIAQWHPFSISKYTHSGSVVEFTCCVKNLGHGWTKSLADLAQKKGNSYVTDLVVRAEGPYGKLSVSPETFDTVVLIAGGIGITFINSLYNEIISNQENASKKSYYVIWSTKDESLLKIFPEMLEKKENVKHSFFVTRQTNQTNDPRFNFGRRPDFREILTRISEANSDRFIGVYACGPREMMIDVHNAVQCASSFHTRFQLHKEVFEM
ncbi:hypothetical protein ABK040_005930 [Willaertia magna]